MTSSFIQTGNVEQGPMRFHCCVVNEATRIPDVWETFSDLRRLWENLNCISLIPHVLCPEKFRREGPSDLLIQLFFRRRR